MVINRSVLYLLYCLVFVNGLFINVCCVFLGNLLSVAFIVPFELLSLYFDVPWIVLLNDFRHGLLIGGICVFFTVFISKVVSSIYFVITIVIIYVSIVIGKR